MLLLLPRCSSAAKFVSLLAALPLIVHLRDLTRRSITATAAASELKRGRRAHRTIRIAAG
jgi:hypothetical protein